MTLLRRIIFALLVSSPLVEASAQGTITVAAGTTTAAQLAPSTKLAVPVVLDMSQAGGANVATVGARVLWGANRLTLDSIKAAGFGTLTTITGAAAQGEAAFNVASPSGTTTTVTLATMFFTSTGTVGGTRVDIDFAGVSSPIGVQLANPIDLRNLDVCVSAFGKWGDVNGDTLVNIIDAQQIARASIALSVANGYAVKVQGDVNNDSLVNVIDAQQLARFAVGLSAPPRTATSVFVPPEVSAVTLVQGTSASVAMGRTLQLGARPTAAGGALVIGCAPVGWKSSDMTKVRVSMTGLVTGVALGSATVTATAGDKNATIPVTVATSAALAPAALEIVQGDGQYSYRNAIAPVDPVVRVKDAAGKPMAGVAVEFTVAPGFGSVNGPASGQSTTASTSTVVVTDSLGQARLARQWNTSSASGATSSVLTAAVQNSALSVTITANFANTQFAQHSCMLVGGTAKCWGDGGRGQLGNGGSGGSSVPVTASGGITFARLSEKVGGDFSCGVAADGKAYCWGDNSGGQLGDSSRTSRNVPTLVAGGLTWSRISTGTLHSCGLTTTGAAYCWGMNIFGQIGDSTAGVSYARPAPVRMPAGVTFTEISAGLNFTCALTSTGAGYCWGFNGSGQIGEKTTTNRWLPSPVAGAPAFTKIAAGAAHACGLTATGAAWCWGDNSVGQTGVGSIGQSALPAAAAPVVGGQLFSEIAAGNSVSCATKSDGSIYCWGSGSNSQIGDGGSSLAASRPSPVLVPVTGSAVFLGGFNSCAIHTGGQAAFCWGTNNAGQVGDGTSTTRSTPVSVQLVGATAGTPASIAATVGSYSQAGSPSTAAPTAPAAVVRDALGAPVSGVSVTFSVTGGGGTIQNTTAVTDASGAASAGTWTLGAAAGTNFLTASITVGGNGTAKALWFAMSTPAGLTLTKLTPDTLYIGSPNDGQFLQDPAVKVRDSNGNPVSNVLVTFTTSSGSYSVRSDSTGVATLGPLGWGAGTPLNVVAAGVSGSLVFTKVSVANVISARATNCALAASGVAYCWGAGNPGHLGDGTTANRGFAAPVSGTQTFASLSSGQGATRCALTSSGAAFCWGSNESGQVGDGTTTTRLAPTAVSGGLTFRRIVTQVQTTCALTLTNQLYCWGWLQSAGMGDPTLRSVFRSVPTLVNTGTVTFTEIGLIDNGFCGIAAAGALHCAAYNGGGAKGIGSFESKATLDPVVGGLTFAKVFGGSRQFCGITVAGDAYCWGSAFISGLGTGENVDKSAPTPIAAEGPFTEITLGNGTGCALRADGAVYCWGNNGNGQAGVGSANTLFATPVMIPDMAFQHLSPSTFRGACGQVVSGMMYCWGQNSSRELGDSTLVSQRSSPVAVVGWPDGPGAGTPVTLKVGSSWAFPLAGTPGTAVSAAPQVIVFDRFNKPVQNVNVTFEVTAGGGTLIGSIVKTDSTGTASATSWTLGPDLANNILTARVAGLPSVQLVAGASFGNGINVRSLTVASGDKQLQTPSGTLYSNMVVQLLDGAGKPASGQVRWKITSGTGTLTSGTSTSTTSLLTAPNQLTGQVSIGFIAPSTAGTTTISAALFIDSLTYNTTFTITTAAFNDGRSRCEFTTTGAAYCWGDNRRGQIGDATTTNRSLPTAVSGAPVFASLAEGAASHQCGLTSGGLAYCWGSNSFGQLGDSTGTDRPAAALVRGGLTFTQLAVSRNSSCGLTSAGSLYCWGWAGYSLFGDNVNSGSSRTPRLVETGGVTFAKFTMGSYHICGLTSGGTAFCWGLNDRGQVGDGTTIARTVATRVNDGRSYKAITAGESFTCAVTLANEVFCWGRNSEGELGDGTTTDRTSPIPVAGGISFASISAARFTVCGLNSTGQAYCWGENAAGQLGDGTTTNRPNPVLVSGGIAFSAIRVREFTNCGRATTGQPFCWGDNALGSVGDGTTTSRPTPFAVKWVEGTAGVVRSVMLNAGDAQSQFAGFAVATNPSVIVRDFAGNPVSGATVTFAVVSGGGTITGASATTNTSGVATVGGWTLGSGVGTNNNTISATIASVGTVVFTASATTQPASLSLSAGNNQSAVAAAAVAIAPAVIVKDANNNAVAGVSVTFAVAAGGGAITGAAQTTNASGIATVGSWTLGTTAGANTLTAASGTLVGSPVTFTATGMAGALASITVTPNPASMAVSSTQQFSFVGRDASGNTVAIAPAWSVVAGGGSIGSTGLFTAGTAPGTFINTVKATSGAISGTATVVLAFTALTAGSYHSCGLTNAGTAFCWGYDSFGQLGDGTTTNRLTPVAVQGGLVFTALAAGLQSSCGLTSTGAAYCWGYNGSGQLGDGTTTTRATPVPVQGGLAFTALAAGNEYVCGLTNAGAAYCWGYNVTGALGDGTTTTRFTPVPVQGGLVFTALSAGSTHTCGLTNAGAAYCWGNNNYGGLGDGTTTTRSAPVAVQGGLVFTAVTAGEVHSCGLTGAGAAYCWGYNLEGEIGDGTTTDRLAPTAVQGGRVFTAMMAGYRHNCGLLNAGEAYCWGKNLNGQLGDGTTTQRLTPMAVQGGLAFTALTAGVGHSCGRTSAGAAYCWGANGLGELGDGTTTSRQTPVAVIRP